MDHNPYDPPSSDQKDQNPVHDVADVDDLDDLNDLLRSEAEVPMTDAQAAALRRPLLTHEAWLQSIGSFVMLGAALLLFGPLVSVSGVLGALGLVETGETRGVFVVRIVLGLLLTGLGGLCVRGALGLRRLDPNHQMLYTALMGLWCVSSSPLSPLGLWGLYLVHSKAGQTVLSTGYQQVRSRTPQLQAKRSRMTSIVLFLVAVALIDVIATKL
jgi:hypothetical protein